MVSGFREDPEEVFMSMAVSGIRADKFFAPCVE